MAIGGDYGNNGSSQRKNYDRSYYSRLRIKNPESLLALGWTFSGGLMTVTIDQKSPEGFNYDNIAKISLSPTKAKVLAHQLDSFEEMVKSGDIDPANAFGVTSGMNEKINFINISSNKEGNLYTVRIGKFDGQGNITDQSEIDFNINYHYGLNWNNKNDMSSVTKVYYDTLEYEQFKDTVKAFAENMNGALAYSVLDLGRYDYGSINRRFDSIFDKLGIERITGSGNRGSNNFLDNSNSVNHTSIDDIL